MIKNSALLCDRFHAATVHELRKTTSVRRKAAIADQRLLFPHRGQIELFDDCLKLGAWRTFAPGDVFNVSMDFLPEYSRVIAAGDRGGFPSFGVLKRLGAPLVLDLRTGERIALLIGYTWWSGTTKDARWLPELKAFAAQTR